MNSKDDASGSTSPQLTQSQQMAIERARKVGNSDAHQLAQPQDFPKGDAFVFAVAFGEARAMVRQLLDIIDELTGGVS